LTDGAVMLSDAELGLLYPPQLPPESMSLVTFPIEANQPTKIPGNIVHNIPNASYLKRFFLQDSPDARRKKCLEGAEKRKSVNPVIVPPTLWSSIELSMVLVPTDRVPICANPYPYTKYILITCHHGSKMFQAHGFIFHKIPYSFYAK